MRFFLPDDEKLQEIKENYTSGKLLTGELKAILIAELQKLVGDIQGRKAKVTEEMIDEFMRPRKLKFNF